MDSLSLPQLDGTAPERVDELFLGLTEEEKTAVIVYLMKHTYTHDAEIGNEPRQGFLWLVYGKLNDIPEKFSSLVTAWNFIYDNLEDKKSMNITIDYNRNTEKYIVLVID